MASPDVRPLVDLTLYDSDPRQLVDRILLDAAVKFPGWRVEVGHTETALIESLALAIAELVYAVNRLPGTVLEVLLRLFGLTRSDGAPPTATALLGATDAGGYVIPAGTPLMLTLPGFGPVTFTTDTDVTIDPGDVVSPPVAITGTVNTDAANGVAVGTALGPVSDVVGLETAELDTAPVGGAGPEGAAEFLARAVSRLDRLSLSLVLPGQFRAYVTENPAITRAMVLDRYDPAVGPAPGDNLGHVTVIAGTAGGAALDAGTATALEADLEAHAQAGLAVHVAAPTVTPVGGTVDVVRLAGADPVDVEAAVRAALAGYLNPDTWGGVNADVWPAVVRRFELIALMDRAEGVDYVDTLTAPAADVALPGDGPLPSYDAGGWTVNVLDP